MMYLTQMYRVSKLSNQSKVVGIMGHVCFSTRTAAGVRDVAPSLAS